MKAKELMEQLYMFGYDGYYGDLVLALYKEINERLEILDIICDNYQIKKLLLNFCRNNEHTPCKQQSKKLERFLMKNNH